MRTINDLPKLHKLELRFPLNFPLCYIFPYGFTNSHKGKYKGAGHPVDVRFAPTVAKRRPQDVQWTSTLNRP